jgi:hypothetical protein
MSFATISGKMAMSTALLLLLPARSPDLSLILLSGSTASPAGFNTVSSPSRPDYVGDEACSSCHKEKVESVHATAHYLTSRLPGADSIFGSFASNTNILKTSNPELFFRMDARDDGFFQTSVQGLAPYITSRSERFDLVVGSGGKGQTYLFWKGDQLFQLPVSYWREVGWINSPGYRDGVAHFDRPVVPRCLECHGTYFDALPPPPNRYSKAGFVVGITCEKCHGPGRAHVQLYASKTAQPADSAILNPMRFSRERQMDLCAWCHAGHGTPVLPSFSYVPGEPLAKYLDLPQPDPAAAVDVHGSQVELLQRSRCYQSSGMTCLTCHDVHMQQHDAAKFSQVCLTCHKPQTPTFPKQGHQADSDCVACHMLAQETNLIVFDWNGKKVRPTVRSHWIKVYAQQFQH